MDELIRGGYDAHFREKVLRAVPVGYGRMCDSENNGDGKRKAESPIEKKDGKKDTSSLKTPPKK